MFYETTTKGEVSEWSKVHDWKSCVAKVTEGSNPSLSAPVINDRNYAPSDGALANPARTGR